MLSGRRTKIRRRRKDFEYAQLPNMLYEGEPTKAPCGCDEEEVLIEGWL